MQQKLAMGRYPILTTEISKNNTKYATVDDIISFFKEKIEENPMTGYVGTFDHHTHTSSIGGQIPAEMKDIKNIVFCFGPQIPNTDIVAIRPRSIGVIEFEGHFVVNFMEAPGAMPNQTMMQWVAELSY
jgi:hypothetical protein